MSGKVTPSDALNWCRLKFKDTNNPVNSYIEDAVAEYDILKSQNAEMRNLLEYIIQVLEVEADFHSMTGFVISRDNLNGLCARIRTSRAEINE